MTRGVGGESPANIMKHMKGIDFPADKQQIIEHARNGEGPDTQEVVQFLEKIPERQYESPAQIVEEIGKIE